MHHQFRFQLYFMKHELQNCIQMADIELKREEAWKNDRLENLLMIELRMISFYDSHLYAFRSNQYTQKFLN